MVMAPSSREPGARSAPSTGILVGEVGFPDFAAMTRVEIIEHCCHHYGVLLDSDLAKSALVSEAEALTAPRLPDALVDDLMT
jgi:hypothetical protein